MARRKTADKKVTRREVDIPKVQADDHSIAFDQIHVGGNVGGDIRIGHTIGYTADQVSVLLKQITTTLEPKKFDGRCPYKGLEVFEEEDAELFFGRERLVNELTGRVKESRTVFITGPSGSGKSSLVRAGLIHALKQGRIKSSDRWLYETMKPGREPIKDLALAFSRLKSPELEDYFLAHAGETEILNKCAESVLSEKKDQRFVLFVDQFEEIFTQINQEEERVAFINMLAHAGTIENGRVIVLFAMRSDFVSNCATYPLLNEMLSQQFRQIGAMQPEELVSAIALPAMHVGLPVENELIARIINDMKGEPGALPLMQFALKDLFDSQQEKGGVIALRLEDYLRHGGIEKSLERHADATFAELNENEQELTRSIFSGLIEIGRGTQDTKRTALFDELVPANTKPEDIETIIRKLADARLIITDEQAGKDTVTISHEKLIEAWPWLKKLVNENRDVIALQNEIAGDAKEWDDHQRDPSYLYTGARLANAREQLEAKKLVLSDLAQLFVDRGVETELAKHREQERQRQKELEDAQRLAEAEAKRAEIEKQRAEEQTHSATNLRKRSLYLAVALVIAILSVGVTVWFSIQSQQQANIALARQLAAQAQSIYLTGSSTQDIAVLLAVQSMQTFPFLDAAQILENNTLAYPVASFTYPGDIYFVVFSSDGKNVASSSSDGTVYVWEASTGKEVARMTHGDFVTAVSFSPNGKYVVSASRDGTARVWEAATGKEVARMTYGDANSVAFSADGRYVVSGGCDKYDEKSVCNKSSIRMWEANTGREITHIVSGDEVISVAFSPDGKWVFSSGRDETTHVWEPATGKEIARWLSAGYIVAFSPDGKLVVSRSGDGIAHVLETATGKEVARRTNVTYAVAFSPDSKWVGSAINNTVDVWEASTGKDVTHMTCDKAGYAFNSLVFSPDGRYIASGCSDHTAYIWEIATGKELARMTYDDYVQSVAFSPDGKYLVSGGCDKMNHASDLNCPLATARVWKIGSGAKVAEIASEGGAYGLVLSKDGKHVAAAADDGIHVWEVLTGKEIAHMTYDSIINSIAFSPDGKYLVSSSSQHNNARVWEIATGKEISHITHPYGTFTAVFSPDSKWIVSSGCDTLDSAENGCARGSARVWEAVTGKEVARMDRGSSSGEFSPDGKWIISIASRCDTLDSSLRYCTRSSARVWEADTGKEIARLTTSGELSSAIFSPDGKWVVSGGCDKPENSENSSGIYCTQGSARVWEATTGKEIAHMNYDDWVNSVVFSPNGKYVVSGSRDGTARVWEAATGNEIARMTHDAEVSTVAFSPDGKYVVSGSGDGTTRVWEATTGTEVARMPGGGGAFSPDGRYVISEGVDNSVIIWLWQADDLIANACSHLNRNLTRAEWKKYIGDAIEYEAICPNLPIEPEPTPTVAP